MSRLKWALMLLCCLTFVTPAVPAPAQPWAVYFSPRGGATAAVVAAVDQARTSLHVQAYAFTSRPIIKAVIAAHTRGVEVEVILDHNQQYERYSGLADLLATGVATWLDAAHQIAHNKVMIIDGRTVITGSFNFTWSAEAHNAENLPVIHNRSLARRYEANFQAHLAHSRPAAAGN